MYGNFGHRSTGYGNGPGKTSRDSRIYGSRFTSAARESVQRYSTHTEGPVPPGAVFVFGSNLAGRHGRGAALTALKEFGAVLGMGEGLQGKSYALPTKDARLQTLTLEEIALNVQRFKVFAENNPLVSFYVTRVGCGLAGYADTQIAPLFKGVPYNCILPRGWVKFVVE